jgi:hypothetical protein
MLQVTVLCLAAKCGRTLRWALAVSWFTTVATALTACGPRQTHTAGVVSLEYVGISGSDVVFELKNGSSKKVSFRGTYSILKGADPWDTQIVCEAANGTTGYSHPIALEDRKPASISVSPGDQMRLRMWSQIAAVGKGAHCRLHFKLDDRTILESSEFMP